MIRTIAHALVGVWCVITGIAQAWTWIGAWCLLAGAANIAIAHERINRTTP